MKKVFIIAMLTAVLTMGNVSKAYSQDWTLNTRAWSTNYFTTLIYNTVQGAVVILTTDTDEERTETVNVSAIIPDADLVFPVRIQKEGFDNNPICSAYRSAFRNPFKYIGDYAVGMDASWMPSVAGLYAGAFFKSQEVIFKYPEDVEKNLRGFYFQPRGGITVGNHSCAFEGGVFYDMVVGCGGTVEDNNKSRLSDGLGLDFALNMQFGKHHKSMLQFSMPLHNFFNEDYFGQAGMKRRVGYIMLTHRIIL